MGNAVDIGSALVSLRDSLMGSPAQKLAAQQYADKLAQQDFENSLAQKSYGLDESQFNEMKANNERNYGIAQGNLDVNRLGEKRQKTAADIANRKAILDMGGNPDSFGLSSPISPMSPPINLTPPLPFDKGSTNVDLGNDQSPIDVPDANAIWDIIKQKNAIEDNPVIPALQPNQGIDLSGTPTPIMPPLATPQDISPTEYRQKALELQAQSRVLREKPYLTPTDTARADALDKQAIEYNNVANQKETAANRAGGGSGGGQLGFLINSIMSVDPTKTFEQATEEAAGILGDVNHAKKVGTEEGGRQSGANKAQLGLKGFEQQQGRLSKQIDDAVTLIDNNWATGYSNAAFSGLPNTDARKLNNLLLSIKASGGFETLQQMRENSPTGGALGNVSDSENKYLQAVNGTLDPLDENLKSNLENIKALSKNVLDDKKAAFNADYGQFLPNMGGQSVAPAAPVDSGGVEEWVRDANGKLVRAK